MKRLLMAGAIALTATSAEAVQYRLQYDAFLADGRYEPFNYADETNPNFIPEYAAEQEPDLDFGDRFRVQHFFEDSDFALPADTDLFSPFPTFLVGITDSANRYASDAQQAISLDSVSVDPDSSARVGEGNPAPLEVNYDGPLPDGNYAALVLESGEPGEINSYETQIFFEAGTFASTPDLFAKWANGEIAPLYGAATFAEDYVADDGTYTGFLDLFLEIDLATLTLVALGTDETTPLFPNEQTVGVGGAPGGFVFDIDGETLTPADIVFIDPPATTEYTYTVTDGRFGTFVAPTTAVVNDPDGYTVTAFDTALGAERSVDVAPGGTVDLTTFDPTGVTEFIVSGISTSLLLDPNDSQAFVAGVGFASSGPDLSVLQTPTNVVDVPAVPLPGTAPFLIAGLAGLGLMARRRRG